VLTFSIARDGLDLGFETVGYVAGRARAFSVCESGYLNLCFEKNDEGCVSNASPRMHRGTRRCHSHMSRALVTKEVDVVMSPEKVHAS